MRFEIKNRWTGAVQFDAEIECGEDASYSVRLGLAVKCAVKARADLSGADLFGADLFGADLTRANLAGANLAGANLARANLAGAYLAGAYLDRADLSGANLTGAYLNGAYLNGAYLDRANLTGAYLTGAYLNGISGLNDWIKCIQVEDWPISYTSDVMQIGCQCHTFDAWRNFSDAEIRAMDGRKAVAFWGKWKSVIFQIIEMAPAQTTKDFAQVEASQ